jgi:hypothetical protein
LTGRDVRLVAVPPELFERNLTHLGDLLHELRIARAGHTTGDVPLDPGLAQRMDAILAADAAACRVLWEPPTDGRGPVDLALPAESAEACRALLAAVDEADDLCRDLQLLTLAAPPEVIRLRRWMREQIEAQRDRGEEPTPFGAPKG